MKKLLVVCALVLGFGSVSQAGILLEPYLGYEMGKTDPGDGELNGTVLGARIAWTAPLIFWLGADIATSVSEEAKRSLGTDDAKRTVVGAVVGVDFPILVRAWLSYGFLNDLKVDSAKLEGTQTKVGVGFTGLPFVSLNLEYIKDAWDKSEGQSIDSKNEAYMLSVSLPLEF